MTASQRPSQTSRARRTRPRKAKRPSPADGARRTTRRTVRGTVRGTARVVAWPSLAHEAVSLLVARRVERGRRLEAVRYVYRPGAEFARHSHPQEQMTFVVSGRIAFLLDDGVLEAGPGEMVLLPASVPHGARVVGRRTAVTWNVFTPIRKELPRADAR